MSTERLLKMETTEKRLYCVGCLGILGVMAYLLVAKYTSFDLLSFIPPCGFRCVTGLYCPGCGGTRAVRALLRGEFITSFLFHPFVMYCAVIAGVFMISNTLQLIVGKRMKIGMKYRHGYLYGSVAVLVVNWIVQNIYILLTK